MALNKYSARVTQPRSQGASQAMLYGIGLTRRRLAEAAGRHLQHVVRGQHLQHAPRPPGGRREGRRGRRPASSGMRFNTIGVSDGLSMGTDGMSYSLPSRDLIADSIETVMGAQWYDALVTVPGCDKNMPGSVIAMARLNRPSLMVYGGTIRAGPRAGQAARHHLGVPVLRRVSGRDDHRRAAARHRAALLPGRRRLRRHVHGQHDGRGHRGAGAVAAVQLVHAGRGSGQGRGVPRARPRPCGCCSSAT